MRKSFIILSFFGASFTTALLFSDVNLTSQVAFLDVGQGDAIFLQTKQGHQILIDGGPDDTVLSGLGEVMPFWDKTLDLLVLTHPDADHITGLIAVLDRYEVTTVLWTGKRRDTKVFSAFAQALQREGAKEIIATAGKNITFEGSDAVLEILYPFLDTDIEKTASNETSIIARFTEGEHTVMLTGDTTEKIEKLLIGAGENLRADILKIAHRGSRSSSFFEFLQAVDPEIAIISVGKDNKYGHPNDETLVNLFEYGIKVQRTDQEGTIIINVK